MNRKGVIIAVVVAVLAGILIGRISKSQNRWSAINPDRAVVLPESKAGNFTLSIWNQSFEIPNAEIVVELQPDPESPGIGNHDLKKIFHRIMPVKDQHHVESVTYNLAPGSYEIYAHELKTGTTGHWNILVHPSKKRGVLLNFWKDKDNMVGPGPHFSLDDVDDGFGIV